MGAGPTVPSRPPLCAVLQACPPASFRLSSRTRAPVPVPSEGTEVWRASGNPPRGRPRTHGGPCWGCTPALLQATGSTGTAAGVASAAVGVKHLNTGGRDRARHAGALGRWQRALVESHCGPSSVPPPALAKDSIQHISLGGPQSPRQSSPSWPETIARFPKQRDARRLWQLREEIMQVGAHLPEKRRPRAAVTWSTGRGTEARRP